MADLTVGHEEIRNQFQLLGEKENSISLAIAWALCQSDGFLRRFLKATIGWRGTTDGIQIQIGRHEGSAGYTDIEVIAPGHFHVIVEAKKGWNLPDKKQLSKYARRKSFGEYGEKVLRLVTLSECSQEYAQAYLPAHEINGVPVVHVSWKEVVRYARAASQKCGHAEKRLLRDLIGYLGGVMTTRPKDSNRVFVVSLNSEKPKGWDLTWIEIVTLRSRYFHPIAAKWPKESPAYIAFRYDGQLQSIHYIKKCEVITDLAKACKGIPPSPVEKCFLYHLGPAIRPSHRVGTGKIRWAGHAWCALDTLLTSKTISEARDITNARMETQ